MEPLLWSATDRETLSEVLPDAVVVLPVGATEQHGPHLATGTDTLMAEATARDAAAQAAATSPRPFVLCPTMPFGASDHHLPFGGTMSLVPETLFGVLLDLLRSIATSGGRRVVLVNGHGGNVGTCQSVAAAAAARYDIAVAYLDYWRLAGEDRAPVPGHAGEFETSLVAATKPDWVRPVAPREHVSEPPTIADADIYTSSSWRVIDGFTDHPDRAEAGDGSRRLAVIVDALAARLTTLATSL